MKSQKQISKFGLSKYLLSLPECKSEKKHERLTYFKNLSIKDVSLRGFANKERKEWYFIPFVKCQFENVDFRNMNVAGLKFDNVHFKNCNFSKSLFRGCFVNDCVFENCNFSDSKFQTISISKSLIIKSNFNKTCFESSHIHMSIFVNTKFENAALSDQVRCNYYNDASNIFIKCNFDDAKINSGIEKTVFDECSMLNVLFKCNVYCITFSGNTNIRLHHNPMNLEHGVSYVFVGSRCIADDVFYYKIRCRDVETKEGLAVRNPVPAPYATTRSTGFSAIFPNVGRHSVDITTKDYDVSRFATSILIPPILGTNSKKDSIYKIFISDSGKGNNSLELIAHTINYQNDVIAVNSETVCEFTYNWFIKNSDSLLKTIMNKLKELSGIDPIESIKLKILTDKQYEM